MIIKTKESQISQPLRSFIRYVAPSLSNEELTDENIGWFD